VVDPFWGGGKEDLTGRMSSTGRCGRPEGNGNGGGVRGWWLTARVRGGCTQRRGARGMVKMVGERLEWAVHGGGNNSAVGGEKRRRKKGCSTVGGGCPL
jgi:hypothetical protein